MKSLDFRDILIYSILPTRSPKIHVVEYRLCWNMVLYVTWNMDISYGSKWSGGLEYDLGIWNMRGIWVENCSRVLQGTGANTRNLQSTCILQLNYAGFGVSYFCVLSAVKSLVNGFCVVLFIQGSAWKWWV